MNLQHRATQKELLDQPLIPFDDIRQNMKELEFINQYLGGHAITLAGLKKLSTNNKDLYVCEIGSGGGDNLHALNSYCKKNNINATFTGIDINPECVIYANSRKTSSINFIINDYSAVKFADRKPDIIFSSLFCHHFLNNELTSMLRWMNDNSTIGYFINDLHRHSIAYHFIKFATAIFSKSYLVKHDAPLSVAKGFKKTEWLKLLSLANAKNYTVQWKWAFRHLITVKH
ncbi:MAG: methyltransferase domain-containing protein [Ginsengibacter sp.]